MRKALTTLLIIGLAITWFTFTCARDNKLMNEYKSGITYQQWLKGGDYLD